MNRVRPFSRGLMAVIALCVTMMAFASCTSAFDRNLKKLPPPRTTPGTERVEFDSALLGKKMAAYVYLPPGYRPDGSYPVVYMLHGFSNNEIEWFEYHHMDARADELIAAGKIAPCVIVAPMMDNGWGLDSGKPSMAGPTPKRALFYGPYETYFLKEVMKFAESRYAVSKEKSRRSIGGVSMGGYAALHIGLRHPELFGRIGAHSPAIAGTYVPDFFLYGPKRPRAGNDPLELAKTAKLDGTEIFIDCGTEDGLFAGAKAVADALAARGQAVTFLSGPGAHEGAYWDRNVARYLEFYADK